MCLSLSLFSSFSLSLSSLFSFLFLSFLSFDYLVGSQVWQRWELEINKCWKIISISLTFHLSLSVCLSVSLFVYFSFSLSLSLTFHFSLFLFVCLFASRSVSHFCVSVSLIQFQSECLCFFLIAFVAMFLCSIFLFCMYLCLSFFLSPILTTPMVKFDKDIFNRIRIEKDFLLFVGPWL